MKQTRVPSADGLTLAVYEAGNPDGPEILLLHGFSQSSPVLASANDGPRATGPVPHGRL